jgi:hypothetical protein
MEHMAAMRAQWFAQMTETIESAQRLAWQLRTDPNASSEARELYGKLEAVRSELDLLCAIRPFVADSFDHDWLLKLGWVEPE